MSICQFAILLVCLFVVSVSSIICQTKSCVLIKCLEFRPNGVLRGIKSWIQNNPFSQKQMWLKIHNKAQYDGEMASREATFGPRKSFSRVNRIILTETNWELIISTHERYFWSECSASPLFAWAVGSSEKLILQRIFWENPTTEDATPNYHILLLLLLLQPYFSASDDPHLQLQIEVKLLTVGCTDLPHMLGT